MAPTPKEISVSLEALRADADQWASAAGTMNAAATRADLQKVDAAAFSFAGLGAAQSYELLRDKLARLLHQGASAFDSIAVALRASADSYEADEATGAHRMRKIY
jgi:uncharacterized protein YukE